MKNKTIFKIFNNLHNIDSDQIYKDIMNVFVGFSTFFTLLRKETSLLACPLPETKVISDKLCIFPWKKHTPFPLLLGVQYRKTQHMSVLKNKTRLSYYNVTTSLVDLVGLCWFKQNLAQKIC